MPQGVTATATDAFSRNRGSPAASSNSKGGTQDPVRAALVAAADVLTTPKLRAAKSIADDLEGRLEGLVPGTDPTPEQDPCANPEITQLCATRQQALKQANFTYEATVENATTTLKTARLMWTGALGQYDFAMYQAEATLQQSVATAVSTYNSKWKKGSGSPSFFLYFTMKQQIATALAAFERTAGSAGATLAGQLGTLTAAYQAYLVAIHAAASQRLDEEAADQQIFWQSVEGALDGT